EQVRILAARPNGKSGGGVDRRSLPSLAPEITPVKRSQEELCKDTRSRKREPAEPGCVVSHALRGRVRRPRCHERTRDGESQRRRISHVASRDPGDRKSTRLNSSH